jgi:hypothetical protein
VYIRQTEYPVKRGGQDKLGGLVSAHPFRQIFHYQPHISAFFPIIEVECRLAPITQLKTSVSKRCTENDLDAVLVAGAAFRDAAERFAVDVLHLQNPQRLCRRAYADGKPRAVMTVQFSGFPIEFMYHFCSSVFQ